MINLCKNSVSLITIYPPQKKNGIIFFAFTILFTFFDANCVRITFLFSLIGSIFHDLDLILPYGISRAILFKISNNVKFGIISNLGENKILSIKWIVVILS